MPAPKFKYAGYPTARVYPSADKKKKNIHELLWGDWVRITGNKTKGFYPVSVRGVTGFVHQDDLQDERLLEIVFVDVGQGDGALVVTPKDKHMVVDAGLSDNMYRFLHWRYAGFKRKWTFEAGVITHPDSDHYAGFLKLFQEENVHFDTIYHNGIIETAKTTTKDTLGKSVKDASDGEWYIEELMETNAQMRAFLKDVKRYTLPSGNPKKYASMLATAMNSKRTKKFEMLSCCHSDDGFMPGYGPNGDLSIRVLGPVVEEDGGETYLRWFERYGKGGANKGQTKNGHSVLLKIEYRDVSILLGGDLNWASEKFLLEQHAGREIPPENATEVEKNTFLGLAREVFECDVVKSCHHGAADFMNLFLQACDNSATVVSSGDQESHAHPRSDTLGAIGKYGYGDRPLVFSTELARSTREVNPSKPVTDLLKAKGKLDAEKDKKKRAALKKKVEELTDKVLERNVTVYGAINLRTDGRNIVMAQKLEQPRSTSGSLTVWDVYPLERNASGRFEFRAKAGAH